MYLSVPTSDIAPNNRSAAVIASNERLCKATEINSVALVAIVYPIAIVDGNITT